MSGTPGNPRLSGRGGCQIQNLFCETDKYCREALPGLASARSKIKARFTPDREPLGLFFPPRWGINDLLPGQPMPGVPSGAPCQGQLNLFGELAS